MPIHLVHGVIQYTHQWLRPATENNCYYFQNKLNLSVLIYYIHIIRFGKSQQLVNFCWFLFSIDIPNIQKMHSRFLILLIVSTITSCSQKEVKAPEPVLPVPSAAQLAWHEMEMNAFIHFTTNTFTDKEWGYGDEKESVFNPTALDVDQWMDVIAGAGFKGVILTTKHHDGFCLWPTAYTEHSVKNSPFKGDIVKEVAESSRRHRLKFGIYLSPWDRNRADYGTPAYLEYYRNQLKELFTNYGPVFEMWFDGANGGDGYYGGAREKRKINGKTYYDWPTTLSLVKSMEPEVILFSDAGPGVRWVGNEKGLAGETNWNTITPDTLYAGKAGIENLLNTGSENGSSWIPAEVDVSIRPGWFYHAAEDSLVKSPERLFEIYLTSVGRGSTLLLNIPPDRRGLIHERDVEVLRQWRELLDNEFRNNLAAGAKIVASATRGGSDVYSGSKMIDGDKDTYWTIDDGNIKASVEVDLGKVQPIKYVMIQEYIKLGQRVKGFEVQAFINNEYRKVAEGTTIGYKRILKLDNVSTDKIRVIIHDARACPVISNLAIY
jgi:alpha-L-fucosidase